MRINLIPLIQDLLKQAPPGSTLKLKGESNRYGKILIADWFTEDLGAIDLA